MERIVLIDTGSLMREDVVWDTRWTVDNLPTGLRRHR